MSSSLARDAAGTEFGVQILFELEDEGSAYALAAPEVAPDVPLLFRREGEVLCPVQDEVQRQRVILRLLSGALSPGEPVEVDLADGTQQTLYRRLVTTFEGQSFQILGKEPRGGPSLVFHAADEGLTLVRDAALIRRVETAWQEQLARLVGPDLVAAESGQDPVESRVEAEAGEPPSLEEGQKLLATFEEILARFPVSAHVGAEYQELARQARELREGLNQLERLQA